jgi:hypothetical protein
MTTWHPDELRTIAQSPVIHVSPKRARGGDRPFTPIWAVAVDGELYVRSHLGDSGAWYRAALSRGHGRIRAGGVERDVAFEVAGGPGIDERIDAEYTTKYHGSAYLPPMLSSRTRAATLRVIPAA